jgi:hypothetical protein
VIVLNVDVTPICNLDYIFEFLSEPVNEMEIPPAIKPNAIMMGEHTGRGCKCWFLHVATEFG